MAGRTTVCPRVEARCGCHPTLVHPGWPGHCRHAILCIQEGKEPGNKTGVCEKDLAHPPWHWATVGTHSATLPALLPTLRTQEQAAGSGSPDRDLVPSSVQRREILQLLLILIISIYTFYTEVLIILKERHKDQSINKTKFVTANSCASLYELLDFQREKEMTNFSFLSASRPSFQPPSRHARVRPNAYAGCLRKQQEQTAWHRAQHCDPSTRVTCRGITASLRQPELQ